MSSSASSTAVTLSDVAGARAVRLDSALVARGLAPSRSRAVRLIGEGLVTVDGRPAVKASLRVTEAQRIEVEGAHSWVSRAALKLERALEAFGVDPAGRYALDVGASTGGFTEVLLARGALGVVALDVGHSQLDPSLSGDDRVSVVEGFNARELTPHALAGFAEWAPSIDLVVADVSFISLTLVLPAVAASVDAGAEFVVLVKPQFEVGRGGTREGIVREAGSRFDAVMGVLWAAWDVGLPTAGVCSSPVLGSAGNHEYLAWFSRREGRNPSEWLEHVEKEVA